MSTPKKTRSHSTISPESTTKASFSPESQNDSPLSFGARKARFGGDAKLRPVKCELISESSSTPKKEALDIQSQLDEDSDQAASERQRARLKEYRQDFEEYQSRNSADLSSNDRMTYSKYSMSDSGQQ